MDEYIRLRKDIPSIDVKPRSSQQPRSSESTRQGTDGAVDAVEMKRRDSRIKIGFKSDVWALGVILFQLTYGGSTPFAQVPGGKVARIQALISLEHEVDFEPIGDAHLLDTMKLCLMKDPANRATVARLLKHPFLRPC